MWWFRTDGPQDDPARLGQRRASARSASSSTATSSPTPRPRGETIRDDSFLLLFNAHSEDVTFTLPARRFGDALGARADHRRAGCASAAASGLRRPAAERRLRRSLGDAAGGSLSAPGAANEVRCSRDLPAAARARTSGFREARALVPYLRDLGVSHLYLSPSLQARPGSTHGYDVVDPARCPTISAASEAALASWPRCRPRGRPRHRPQPHGGDDENPFWADQRAAGEVLRHRPGHRPPPALLRHRRPRRRAPGGPRGVRGDPREAARARRRRRRRRAARRPRRRARRPGGVSRAAAGARRRARLGREDPESGEQLRDWPVEGTVGYEFLNDVTALFVDPAGEDAADGAVRRAHRRAARVLRRSRSRPSSSRRRRPSRPRSSGCAGLGRDARRSGASGAGARRCPSTAPTSSPAPAS